MQVQGSLLELRDNLLQIICLRSSGACYSCPFHLQRERLHIHVFAVSFLHAHKVLQLPGQHRDTRNIFHHKTWTSAAEFLQPSR